MLAPYWSYIDPVESFVTGPSKVFYQVYSDTIQGSNTTLTMATADVMKLLSRPLPTNFSATWVLVVTWEKLRPQEYTAAPQNLVRYVQDNNTLNFLQIYEKLIMFSINGTNLLQGFNTLT